MQDRIQRLQNSCICFVYGLRKYDHISDFIKGKNILNMRSRCMTHNLTLMFKIKKKIAPGYLCDRVLTHELHKHQTRHKHTINPPYAKSTIRSMSFFINISKKFNLLSAFIDCQNISVSTFKKRCSKYFLQHQ